MARILIQALLLVALFFGVYNALRQVDWMRLFEIKQKADKTEKKLGDMLWKIFSKSDREVKDKLLTQSLDSILVKLCDNNDIRKESIRLHILEKDEVNAFALPDGHLVVYTGLIAACERPEELAGVMAHELAHIELDHVMKRLVKEIGLSVLVSMTTGSGGGEIAREIAHKLSSSAFDRRQEKEADIAAVDYMAAADIDPEPFGEFLYRLGGESGRMGAYLSWISTHPDSRERGEYVIDYAGEKTYDAGPVLEGETWKRIREELQAESIPARPSPEEKLGGIVQGKRLKFGFFALAPGNGDTFSLNGAERFPMQSVFKFHIALAVLERVDKGLLKLDRKVPVSETDVSHQLYSPIRERYPSGTDDLTLDSLIRYTVAQSDNTGCDVLLRLLGGPGKVQQFIEGKGIREVAIVNTEQQLQGDWSVQYRNWTTPRAAVMLLEKFYKNEMVSAASTKYLLDIMLGTVTGAKRIKGLLPEGTPVAHKTGWSGMNKDGVTAATNDIGLMFLPDGRVVAIAAFVRDSRESAETNEEVIARASKVCWEYFSELPALSPSRE